MKAEAGFQQESFKKVGTDISIQAFINRYDSLCTEPVKEENRSF